MKNIILGGDDDFIIRFLTTIRQLSSQVRKNLKFSFFCALKAVLV